MFSFSSRKKSVELHSHVRRIADLTVPNLQLSSAESVRSENRYNRCIPVLTCVWDLGIPDVESSAFALAVDLSDNGVRLLTQQQQACCELVIGFWPPTSDLEEPWYFLADCKRCAPIGGGFWAVGVELNEFANTDHRSKLAMLDHLAEELLPDISTAMQSCEIGGV